MSITFFYYVLSFPAKSNVDDNWNELICIPSRRHLNKYILTNPLSSFQVIYVYILPYTWFAMYKVLFKVPV